MSKEHRSKTSKLLIACFILTGIIAIFVLVMCLYIPCNYSTVNNRDLVKKITNELTNNGEGIKASDLPINIQNGTDTELKSNYSYLKTYSDERLLELSELQELGVLDNAVPVDDLWAIYNTYYLDEYQSNVDWLRNLGIWYDNLNTTEVEHTCNDVNCPFVRNLSHILNYDVQTIINSNAHNAYHMQLEEAEAGYNLDDTSWHLIYESYILSSPEFIKELTIHCCSINQTLAENVELSNWAFYGNKFLVNWQLGHISYNVTFKDNIADALKYFNILMDEKVIDEKILQYVPNTFKAYGTDADGINVGDTQIVNITGVDNVNEWLKNRHNVKTSILNSEKFIDCGYTTIYWEIENIEHIDNIPTYDELMSNEEWKKEQLHKLAEQSFWELVSQQKDAQSTEE